MKKVTYGRGIKDRRNRDPKTTFGDDEVKSTEQSRSKFIFQPYDPSRPSKSYETVMADLLEKIGNTFVRPTDIKNSLHLMKKVQIEKPRRQISITRDREEQDGFNIEYDNEHRE
jgi:hypothetical protein